jgi:hypothetical protein
VKLQSPSVALYPSSTAAGGFTGELTGYRDKRDGSTEEVVIYFPSLSIHDLRCIGRSVIMALRNKRGGIQVKLDELRDEADS